MSDCCNSNIHPDHSKEISRLNRISGQIEGIKKMVEERRYCPDILTQLRAVASATKSLEATILEAHLGTCVAEAFKSDSIKEQQEKISELVKLFKRFD
jgi:DNA-binding FrmR family transcriptional regulator